MFKQIASRIKNFIGGDELFSSMSVLPFSSWGKSNTTPLSAYEISLYVNKGIKKRAEKVGETEFTLSRGDTILENDPILDLLNNPSKIHTKLEFWKLYQEYYDIFGEVYMVKESEMQLDGKITNLILLRSDQVKPFFNKRTGELTRIEHNTADGTNHYKADEIAYVNNPDPAKQTIGESLLRSGMRQIETGIQIDEYHSKILANGGRVEGVFNFKTGNLNATQLKEIKDAYQKNYGDASKAGLPMFLAGDAKYDRLGLDPAELAYLETKKANFNDIVILTGVPSAILGITSEETFSNADAAIRIFLKETIVPLVKSLTDNLTKNLAEEGLTVGFVDPTPENKEDNRKDLETASNIFALTTNEKREFIGLDEIKGGDDILVPLNLVPLDFSTVAPQDEKGIIKKELKSPACRMSNEKEVDCVSRKIPELMSEGMSQAQAIASAKSMCQNKCKVINHMLRNKNMRGIYHELCVKRLDRRQERVKRIIDMYFEGQKERLVDKLMPRKQFKVKALLDEIFHETVEIKLAKETMLPILDSLMKEAAEDSKEIAGSDWEFNDTPEINGWLDKKTSIFAEQITDTTFKELKKQFSLSLDEGESRLQLIKRIEDTYANISKSRAETIARTEVHGVTQFGTMQGYKQADLPIKIWVWAPGTKGGVRDDHQAMDGEEVPIGDSFSNGLEFPGQPSGGASETINCQCFI